MLRLAVLPLLIRALAAQTTVPLIVEGNVPMIDVDLTGADGKMHRGRFVLDSGGGAFIVTERLAKDLGMKPTGPARPEDGGSYAPTLAPAGRVGGMSLNLRGVRSAILMGEDRFDARDAADGLFPGQLLERYHVVFDYPGRKFTLAPPGSMQPRGTAIAARLRSDNGFPRIELSLGGRVFGFLLDTGASYTMISRVKLEEWSAAGWPRHTGASGFANMVGGRMENEALMTRIPELRTGELVLEGVGAVSRPDGTFEKWMSGMMPAPIVGSIAGNVLRNFRVEIDYKGGMVYLERTGSADVNDMDTVAVTLRGGPVISASADPQLHTGDKLITVDGVPVVGKSLSQVNELLRGKPGDKKKLEVEREGKKVEVEAAVTRLM